MIYMSVRDTTLFHITIILVRAMRVAVESARLSVCGPASVSKAKVCEQLLVQVQQVFFCRSRTQQYDLIWVRLIYICPLECRTRVSRDPFTPGI